MTRHLAPLLSLCLALGCGSPIALTESFHLGEPFWLEIGTTGHSEEGTTTVRYERVASDSRCPGGDIVCIWAGEVTVEVSVATILMGEVQVQLHQVLEPRAVTLEEQGRRVELLAYEDAPGDWPARTHKRSRIQLLVTAVP